MRERQKRKAASCSHLAPSRSAFEGLLAAVGWPGQPGDAHLVCLGCGTRSATLEQHNQRHATPGKPGGVGVGHVCRWQMQAAQQRPDRECFHCQKRLLRARGAGSASMGGLSVPQRWRACAWPAPPHLTPPRRAPPRPAGHEVVLDRRTQELYCTRCADFVYDPEFDALKLVGAAAGRGVVLLGRMLGV